MMVFGQRLQELNNKQDALWASLQSADNRLSSRSGGYSSRQVAAAIERAKDQCRAVNRAYVRAQTGDTGTVIPALEDAASALKTTIGAMEADNLNAQAEMASDLANSISRFVADVKAGRIA